MTDTIQKKIILSKEQEILNAMKSSDVKKMDKLIHDDLVFNIPNGNTITKMMDIDAYKTGNMVIDEIQSTEQLISTTGDNAIVSAIIQMKGRFVNQPFEGTFRVLRVWKQINQQWKIIAGSSIQL